MDLDNALKKYTKLVIAGGKQEKLCQKLKDELRKEWRKYYLLQKEIDEMADSLHLTEEEDDDDVPDPLPKKRKFEKRYADGNIPIITSK